jgi:molybdopterin-containing oxidoreductase family membrane subunit
VARQAYDAAIMAPLFIVMSFSFGLAIFTLVLLAACRADGRPLGEELLGRLGRLQAIFVAVVLYFTAVQHLTNLYAAEHAGIERFILLDGGVFTALFWLGQVLIGGVLPLVLLLHGGSGAWGAWSGRLLAAGLLVVVGGLTQVYVIIIGGQAFPLVLFPGRQVSSSFFDGVVNGYVPSGLEIGLGIGGIALALVIVQLGLGLLQLLPESLADTAPESPLEPEPEPEAATAEP